MRRVVLLAGVALVTATADSEPCCQGDCTEKKNQKYYSIIKNTCEEACFPYEEYDEMLKLNPKLVPSHTTRPCDSHGYSTYLETVTNGEDPFTLTMDVYIQFTKSDPKKCCEVCTIDGEEKYYSIVEEAGNCGESCIRPEDYEKYHQLEANLLPAHGTDYPCISNGYNTFLETETHGRGNFTAVVDMYTLNGK